MSNRHALTCLLVLLAAAGSVGADGPVVHVRSPLSPPAWALLQREVLRTASAACREFYDRYFDERGYLLCVERWGGNDGPDDAIENCHGWPVLHALGGASEVRELYQKAWEGHLRQYSAARTTQVPLARDGMYYKEFPVMFDWLHHCEGLTVFCLSGLSRPDDALYLQRARRYAGFYLNEDPGAPNYDPKHRLIRSLFTGSRGPLLRKATAQDWAGDPIEVANRFLPRHGERSYEEMLAHFKDYTDVVGDHPQNLLATSLPLTAFLLTGQEKYRRWVCEYVDAWRERTLKNQGIIPTNVGLDGTIGGAAGGKWYGGAYGWAFTVTVPQNGQRAHRNTHGLGLAGFGNAYLLTGDPKYLDVWRQMIDRVNAQGKEVGGRMVYPHMHGDQGWYEFRPEKYALGSEELWYWSMAPADRQRLPDVGWLAYLDGRQPDFPEAALRADLAQVRQRVLAMRQDPTTPETRLADDTLAYNPAVVGNLVRLMLGGIPGGNKMLTLHARVRYFDPVERRAGLPEGVAALVEKLSADSTTLTLVNIDQLVPRTVVVQAGAYAEHRFTRVACPNCTLPVDTPHLTVRLEPGAGARLVLGTRRYAAPPTLAHPWDRGWWPLGERGER